MSILLVIMLGVAIGLVLGGLGGGGAILTVPALVFLVGESATAATTSSLIIVGVSAAVGAAAHLKASPNCCRIGWKVAASIAVAGIPSAWLGSHLNHAVDEDVLLLAFSALMLVSAAVMWRGFGQHKPASTSTDLPHPHRSPSPDSRGTSGGTALQVAHQVEVDALAGVSWPLATASGLGIGFLTGFFGVGGGFILVPVLTIVLGLPLNLATGTSLVIVALNSATALAARATIATFDWAVIVPFTVAAIPASVVARRTAVRLPSRQLSRAFAVLQLVVATYTATASLINLT